MSSFTDSSLVAALDRSLAVATHLEVRHAATVAAARALARKIDAWDVIVQWAFEDAAEREARPAVPANDNVSLATFLKYMGELKLVPTAAADSPNAGEESAPVSILDAWREENKNTG